MVTLAVAIAAALACLVADGLHARRVRRIARLAFGPGGRPRAWTRAVPLVRAGAVGLLVWGLATLLLIDGAPIRAAERAGPPRHLVVGLDVSPSMYIQDAGGDGRSTRAERARDVLRSVLERLDTERTRVSIVAFYTTAKPVVVDTRDLNVVDNIIGGLPLEHAFKDGPTNLYAGVRAAADLGKGWAPGSSALVIISDGDTLPDADLPQLPAAFADSIVVGVGDPYRGRQIAGHASRQDSGSLKRLAARLRGLYHDGNSRHLASAVIHGLSMSSADPVLSVPRRTLALAAVGLGGSLIGAIAPALGAFGAPRTVRERERAVRLKQSETEPSDRSSLRPALSGAAA